MSVCRFSDKRAKGEMEFLKGIDFGLNSQFFLTAKKNQNVKSRVFETKQTNLNNPIKLNTFRNQVNLQDLYQ